VTRPVAFFRPAIGLSLLLALSFCAQVPENKGGARHRQQEIDQRPAKTAASREKVTISAQTSQVADAARPKRKSQTAIPRKKRYRVSLRGTAFQEDRQHPLGRTRLRYTVLCGGRRGTREIETDENGAYEAGTISEHEPGKVVFTVFGYRDVEHPFQDLSKDETLDLFFFKHVQGKYARLVTQGGIPIADTHVTIRWYLLDENLRTFTRYSNHEGFLDISEFADGAYSLTLFTETFGPPRRSMVPLGSGMHVGPLDSNTEVRFEAGRNCVIVPMTDRGERIAAQLYLRSVKSEKAARDWVLFHWRQRDEQVLITMLPPEDEIEVHAVARSYKLYGIATIRPSDGPDARHVPVKLKACREALVTILGADGTPASDVSALIAPYTKNCRPAFIDVMSLRPPAEAGQPCRASIYGDIDEDVALVSPSGGLLLRSQEWHKVQDGDVLQLTFPRNVVIGQIDKTVVRETGETLDISKGWEYYHLCWPFAMQVESTDGTTLTSGCGKDGRFYLDLGDRTPKRLVVIENGVARTTETVFPNGFWRIPLE
jgi:hypothetical protein